MSVARCCCVVYESVCNTGDVSNNAYFTDFGSTAVEKEWVHPGGDGFEYHTGSLFRPWRNGASGAFTRSMYKRFRFTDQLGKEDINSIELEVGSGLEDHGFSGEFQEITLRHGPGGGGRDVWLRAYKTSGGDSKLESGHYEDSPTTQIDSITSLTAGDVLKITFDSEGVNQDTEWKWYYNTTLLRTYTESTTASSCVTQTEIEVQSDSFFLTDPTIDSFTYDSESPTIPFFWYPERYNNTGGTLNKGLANRWFFQTGSASISPTTYNGSFSNFQIFEGSLPTGLSLNSTTGAITGSVTVLPLHYVNISADSGGATYYTGRIQFYS